MLNYTPPLHYPEAQKVYDDKMPKSIEEQVAENNLEKAILKLYAIKMKDLGFDGWTVENQGEFWNNDHRRADLVKNELRNAICRVLFKIRVSGEDDNSALG